MEVCSILRPKMHFEVQNYNLLFEMIFELLILIEVREKMLFSGKSFLMSNFTKLKEIR